MKCFKVVILATIVFASFIASLCGCGGGDGTTSTTSRSYLGTQSPGDVWTWAITTDAGGSGTFSATNVTTTYTYSGTVSTLPSKFLKLAITATSDPAITTLPAYAYAFEIPDTAVLVKPAGNNARVIIAAAQGTTPTANGSYNWLTMPSTGWNADNSVAYGVTATTVTGSTFDFSHSYYLLSGSHATPFTGFDNGFSSSNGKITKTGSNMTIGMTPSGVFVGDLGPSMGGFAGMKAPSTNVDLNSVLATGKEYRGVLYKYDASGSVTQLVWGRPDLSGSGKLTGGPYTNVEAGTEDNTSRAFFTISTQSTPGILNGTARMEVSGTTTNCTMLINQINGKYIVFGIFLSDESSLVGKTQPQYFLAMEM